MAAPLLMTGFDNIPVRSIGGLALKFYLGTPFDPALDLRNLSRLRPYDGLSLSPSSPLSLDPDRNGQGSGTDMYGDEETR